MTRAAGAFGYFNLIAGEAAGAEEGERVSAGGRIEVVEVVSEPVEREADRNCWFLIRARRAVAVAEEVAESAPRAPLERDKDERIEEREALANGLLDCRAGDDPDCAEWEAGGWEGGVALCGPVKLT